MSSIIRIGTRDSALAVWQAEQVHEYLSRAGYDSELVFIKSDGDLDLVTPLYAMGVQGVFTRALDVALLNGRIDLAVHSMKDVPIQLPAGIIQMAILPRGPVHDLLLFKHPPADLANDAVSRDIATSSIRRRAQWLYRYPNHQMHNVRGNVQTRLEKFYQEPWDGIIFAQAGLERLGLIPTGAMVLEWMLPAPAQGAILVTGRAADEYLLSKCSSMHDPQADLCVSIERDFLKHLMGGCSTPIGALARIEADHLHFEGNIVLPSGQDKIDIQLTVPLSHAEELGRLAAERIKADGGAELLELLSK